MPPLSPPILSIGAGERMQSAAASAARVIIHGGLVVFPTDTVYGLGADPRNEKAVGKLFHVKKRSAEKPIAVLAAELEDIRSWVTLTPAVFKLAEAFWPGPLTLIAPPTACAPRWLVRIGLGFRVPSHEFSLELCRRCGGLVAATSANLSTQEPPNSLVELLDSFQTPVDLAIDDGQFGSSKASTVLDLCHETPIIRRIGPITAGQLASVLGEPVQIAGNVEFR